MIKFVEVVFHPRVPSFYSRPYKVYELSSNLAEEECAFWHVIWLTNHLKDALNNDMRANTLDKSISYSEKASMMANVELMNALTHSSTGSRDICYANAMNMHVQGHEAM